MNEEELAILYTLLTTYASSTLLLCINALAEELW